MTHSKSIMKTYGMEARKRSSSSSNTATSALYNLLQINFAALLFPSLQKVLRIIPTSYEAVINVRQKMSMCLENGKSLYKYKA